MIAMYQYDAWGNGDANYTTNAALAELNPFRYRGYYYDSETGYYYLNSRYYDSDWGRFLNADTTDILDGANDHFFENNLFAYCFNNPVSFYDPNGEFGATAGVLAVGLSAGAANAWNPAGWAIFIAIIVIVAIEAASSSTYTYAKAPQFDPYSRPGRKKQGRENGEKKKGDGKNWEPRNNRRNKLPREPKKHTPGRDHRKFKPKVTGIIPYTVRNIDSKYYHRSIK